MTPPSTASQPTIVMMTRQSAVQTLCVDDGKPGQERQESGDEDQRAAGQELPPQIVQGLGVDERGQAGHQEDRADQPGDQN